MFLAGCATWQDGNMRSTDIETEEDEVSSKPATCAALDALLSDVNVRSSALADELGVNGSTITRWRDRVEPDRETVLAIENFLDVRPGTIARMAGYVVDTDDQTMIERLEDDPQLTKSNRTAIVGAYKAALAASKAERKEQAQWRTKRRAR